MTLRGWIVGMALALFIAGAGYINDRVLDLESVNNGHQLAIIVTGWMVVAVVLLNPLVFRWRRRRAFRPAEIGLVVILMLAACSIPGRGLMEQFAQALVMPYHWERVTPGWQANEMLGYAPPQTLVDAEDYDDVVTHFVTGSEQSLSQYPSAWTRLKRTCRQVPWSAWARPMRTWVPMVLLSVVSMVGMALIVHRQWSGYEHLQYPISAFTTSLIDREPDRAYAPVLRNRAFWIGFGIVFLIRLNNGLCQWFPDYLIPVRLHFYFHPFAAKWDILYRNPWSWGLLRLEVFPLVIAFAFFLNSEISLTMGLSQILWACVCIPMISNGISVATDYDIGGWQGWHRAGSYTAFTLMLLYAGRHHYWETLRKAVLRWRGGDEDSAAVWGWRLFLVAVAGLTTLVIRLGLSWPIAVGTVLLMLMTFLIVSRISAETGLFFIQPGWQPFGTLMPLFGAYAMGPSSIVVSALVCGVLCIDQSQALMPYLTNGLKIGESLKLRPLPVAAGTTALCAVGIGLAIVIVLIASYDFGTPTHYGWSYHRIPTMPFRAAEPALMQLKATGLLAESEALSGWQRLAAMKPDAKFLWAAGFGFVGVVVFSMLRLRVPWWPLHPVLFLIWATYPLAVMSHSFLLGWMVKKAALRFGGNRLVQRMKPFAIGVIGGEICGALVFMAVGAVYFFWTGRKPITYRYFPR
ncbi:MAG: hypothetical protein JXR77_18485 [Lentisphaeria bacterium]|nr:hypothetical protein [Lentisphaeria bacterium]